MIYDGERIEICILVCFSIAANPLEQKKCNHEAKKKSIIRVKKRLCQEL